VFDSSTAAAVASRTCRRPVRLVDETKGRKQRRLTVQFGTRAVSRARSHSNTQEFKKDKKHHKHQKLTDDETDPQKQFDEQTHDKKNKHEEDDEEVREKENAKRMAASVGA
jgi:hypothetical protein